MGDARYHYIESENVGRGYHIFVSLPVGYDQSSEERYPTIYTLDGGGLFPLLSAYYRLLSFEEEFPSAIIVGISYGSDTFEGGNYRSTDYTAPSVERDHYGGATKFQRFLADELTPFIESTYSSRADRRIIFGTSIGGQFVLFTAMTEPALFWGHIASNPALHGNLEFYLQDHANPASGKPQTRLFVGDGTLNDPRFRVPSQKWKRYWIDRDDTPWELKAVDLEGHSHMSATPASFLQGLHWLFSGK
jgi:predicted alpha/beta superfamily hydrolase